MSYQIYNKDNNGLQEIKENEIDAIVTDPPYGINFQEIDWDKNLPDKQIWKDCYKVLKPGGHILVFSSIRLLHKLVISLEEAGFIMKDILFWMQLNSMPKNRRVDLDIDKELGVKSIEVGEYKYIQGYKKEKPEDYKLQKQKKMKVPASKLARKYRGVGINVKPFYEPIVLLQKPLTEVNIARNIIRWGTGGLNIEETRIPYDKNEGKVGHNPHPIGRMPGNIIRNERFDDEYNKFFVIPKVRKKKEVIKHPTQKPVNLMCHLVKLVSFKGQKVLDPFMGTASTGIACLKYNRKFIGYEINEDYYKISLENLNSEK